MELELIRTYYANGTNGVIVYNQLPVCHSIELPWKENKIKISCIPEGRYELIKRYSQKFKQHFIVKNVVGRTLILIHPANDALKELKGCIAPVLILTGEGKGSHSKAALAKLIALMQGAAEEKETIFLTIKSIPNEKNQKESSISHTQLF
jgi:hypothetical protein